ncbi:hypothetical protein LXL04_001642 [Taraxacum kok-saghyz]
MPTEPPLRKILQPRKPPDPNTQTTPMITKPSMPMRKRRSTSPNSRDQRPSGIAKMSRNPGTLPTNNLPPSLIEKLDSRGLLKTTDLPPLPEKKETVQGITEIQLQIPDVMSQIPEQQVNQTPNFDSMNQPSLLINNNESQRVNMNAESTQTCFEFNHTGLMHTGNLFYSGIMQNPNTHANPTEHNERAPITKTHTIEPTNTNPTHNQTNIHTHQPQYNNQTIPNNITPTSRSTSSHRSYANVTSFAPRQPKAKLQYFPQQPVTKTRAQ